MARIRDLFVATAFCAFATGAAMAADQTDTVRFEQGATASTLSGHVKGPDSVTYALVGAAGQSLSVRFTPDNPSCAFNLFASDTASAIHLGSVAGNAYTGLLVRSGIYRTQVFLIRSAARRNAGCRYKITFSLTGEAVSVAALVGDPAMRAACAGKAATQYGVARGKVILADNGAPIPAGGFSLKGLVDKDAAGKFRFDCRFRNDLALQDVMALNPDGE